MSHIITPVPSHPSVAKNPAFSQETFKHILHPHQQAFENLKASRDANSRTGNCLALGCLHRYVGSMGSGQHFKNSVGVLHALARDTSTQVREIEKERERERETEREIVCGLRERMFPNSNKSKADRQSERERMSSVNSNMFNTLTSRYKCGRCTGYP